MKPTVTLLLEEFDRLRKLAEKGDRFEAMEAEIKPHIMYPDADPMMRVMDLKNSKKYIYMEPDKLFEMVERWFK